MGGRHTVAACSGGSIARRGLQVVQGQERHQQRDAPCIPDGLNASGGPAFALAATEPSFLQMGTLFQMAVKGREIQWNSKRKAFFAKGKFCNKNKTINKEGNKKKSKEYYCNINCSKLTLLLDMIELRRQYGVFGKALGTVVVVWTSQVAQRGRRMTSGFQGVCKEGLGVQEAQHLKASPKPLFGLLFTSVSTR